MYSKVDNPKEIKNKTIANSFFQKNNSMRQGFGLVDNRPVSILQRKLKFQNHTLPSRSSKTINKVERARKSNSVFQRVPVVNTGSGELSVDTELQVQTGPSCWLYVLDSIFGESGNDKYRVGTAKHFYPDSDELDSLMKTEQYKGQDKRVVALTQVSIRINGLIKRLGNIKGDGNVSKADFNKLAGREANSVKSEDITNEVYGVHATKTLSEITTHLQNANAAVNRVRIAIKNKIDNRETANEKDEEILLGNKLFDLSGNQGGATVVKLKEWMAVAQGALPMYMFINKRFRPTRTDDLSAGQLDWTARSSDEMKSAGNHAVMLTALSYGNKGNDLKEYEKWIPEKCAAYDDGYVVYKDPNYGNAELKIKWSHLMNMMHNIGGGYFGITSPSVK
ncbi:hypothetical protein [Vibrio mexicanus]|uniref:hypothetical protein n=1 Tax=Vibrio mexicanus TaxID=1004326 RepID=UPI00063C33CA|nr:hypothetical protein [Vibrio mexicanus]